MKKKIKKLRSNGKRSKEVPEEQTPEELTYPTFHLQNFNHLERATGLYGESYKGVIKAVWYVLNGQIIKEKIVTLGEVQVDCRMNFGFTLKSGNGKKEVEDVITKACNGLGQQVTKPTSYHPEQLVGKIIQEKGEDKQIIGHLGDDILIFDDAIDLVKGQKALYRESRRYITTALDPIGKNLVTKRQTGIHRDDTLQYHPTCSIQILLQPFVVSDEVVKSGFFRRFLFLFPEIERSKDIFSKKTLGNGTLKPQSLSIFLTHLEGLRKTGASQNFTFSKKAIERFNELHLLLVEFGEGYSKKVSSFTEMIDFSLQNWFLKMIAILANSQKRTKVSTFDVEMAFVDLLEFLDSNFKYVEEKVQGSLDYGDPDQPTGGDLEAIEWLKQKGALSFRTSKISIQDFQKKVSKKLHISLAGARRRYQGYVEKQWVKGKQDGPHGSRVWIRIKLNGKKGQQGEQGDRVIAEYHKIIALYAKPKPTRLLTARKVLLLPLLPSKEDEVSPSHPVSSCAETSSGEKEPLTIDLVREVAQDRQGTCADGPQYSLAQE